MSTKFTCRFCKEQFDQPKGLYKHLQLAHSAGSSRDNRTCPICGVLCSKYEGYRDHLLYIHGQSNEGQKLTFKSLNEFLLWKTELEIKYNCKYVLQSAPKVLPSKEKKYFYQCDRSDSKPKEKKSALSVVMKTCSSVISVVEGIGVFKVEYWDAHSGHNDVSPVSVQNELEAAISSVEMVNAIGDSDDSFDKSEEFVMHDNSGSTVSPAEKQAFLKTNTSANVNNLNSAQVTTTVQNTKSIQPVQKVAKKKTANTSILYSLASVACGKGISKKSGDKVNTNRTTNNQSNLKTDINQSKSKTVSEKSVTVSEKNKDNVITATSGSVVSALSVNSVPANVTTSPSVSVTSKITTSSSLPVAPKVTSSPSLPVAPKVTTSGPPAIAPKITTVTTNTIGPLFTSNSAFPNQLVIVNPVSMDQNSANSSQNVLTAGQNILLSLGPLGQNILSTTATAQSTNQIPVLGEKSAMPVDNTSKKAETTGKLNVSNTLKTSKNAGTSVQNVSNGVVTSTATSSVSSPITLSGLNNAPVILSSLPVGSTFMSVNNNLIPIATPSGTFLPTSLPPNIVLAPVMQGSVSSAKTTLSSSVSTAPQGVQNQMRFTAPSTVAITVSSIVREPVYTSTAMKQLNSIVSSSSSKSPISSTAPKTNKLSTKMQNKLTSVTVASKVSSAVSTNKTAINSVSNKVVSVTTTKGSSISANKISPISTSKTAPILSSNIAPASISKALSSTVVNKVILPFASNDDVAPPTATSTPIKAASGPAKVASSPVKVGSSPAKSSARKRISKSVLKTPSVSHSVSSTVTSNVNTVSRPINPAVVNSVLNTVPHSASNIPLSGQLNPSKLGTLLIESAGEIYMLQPVENDPIESIAPIKTVTTATEMPKVKIDRSVQTLENSSLSAFRSKLQRKRAAPASDDSAVMLKVKCYQLEMKYLTSQTECKQLKVELTKEKLKNAELSGKKITINEEEKCNESRNKAQEIMKEIEDKYSENKEAHIYTMTKTSVLRSLYEDLEELCIENNELYKELENYRAHDKFYKSLKKRIYDEDF